MKPFIAIMYLNEEGRIGKYADFDTEQEALDHAARFQHHDPVEHEGDGVKESFDIPFPIKEESDAKITLSDADGKPIGKKMHVEGQSVVIPIIEVEKTETDDDGEEIATVEETNVLRSGEFIRIERALPVYPEAFVAEPPGPYLSALKVDPATKALTVAVPQEKIRAVVEGHAQKLVDAVAPPEKINQMLARSARLNAEHGIKGRALTQAESAEVDQLIAVDDYTNGVRREAERFIRDDLPNLTEDEKLNFDPATAIKWPAQP